MIYFLHGFLGSPEDWNEVLSYLPSGYEYETIDLTQGIPEFSKDAIIVGYSLGGRIALQLDHPGGLVILGAHFGLTNEKEKTERAQEEQRNLQEMRDCPDTFLKKWYAQPLFTTLNMQGDLLKRRQSIDFSKHAELYERFALSKQPLLSPPSHALLLHGEKDEKYAKMYCHFPNTKSIPDAGHAAHIENPKVTAILIQQYVVNIYGNSSYGSPLAGSRNFR
jgi:2-succinyl-6-hydroxy-2,4-cyclohexadiene-1-carboxylate synthase